MTVQSSKKPYKSEVRKSIRVKNIDSFQLAEQGLTIAVVGMEYVNKLRALMAGISAAAKEQKTISELAQLGIYLADDFHNDLDCLREDMRKRLTEVETGAGHE